MDFPENGRVVIVDDEIEKEGLPLAQALWNKGIAVRLFNGRGSELPETPLGAVRLLFLDLNLEGLDFTHDPEDQAKALKPVVERIIGENNGPYILFGWTKTPKCLEILYNVLDNKPVLYLDMEKNDCTEKGIFKLPKIEEKLLKKINEIGHFRTLFHWENIINEATAATVNKIFQGTLRPEEVESVLYFLAKANLGDHIVSASGEQKIKASLQCFNVLLSDTVDSKLNSGNFSSFGNLTSGTAIDHNLMGKINSKLLLSKAFNNEPYPGNVYLEFDTTRKTKVLDFIKERIVLENIAKKIVNPGIPVTIQSPARDTAIEKGRKEIEAKITDENRRIFVEITPLCDYAQNNHKYHRIISGFLIECDHYKKLENEVHEKSGFYESPHIFLENGAISSGCFRLVLDCRGLVTLALDSLKDITPLFRINDEFLFDIQHKAGSHFSRPGITFLN